MYATLITYCAVIQLHTPDYKIVPEQTTEFAL